MGVTALQAAKHACETSGWKLTNLQLQKILYIAHMLYLGNNNEPLINNELFQAWDYGPVLPTVYHHVSSFGALPVKNVFRSVESLDGNAAKEAKAIEEAVEQLKKIDPFRLVQLVHDDKSAWVEVYDPRFRDSAITNELVKQEFTRRTLRKKETAEAL